MGVWVLMWICSLCWSVCWYDRSMKIIFPFMKHRLSSNSPYYGKRQVLFEFPLQLSSLLTKMAKFWNKVEINCFIAVRMEGTASTVIIQWFLVSGVNTSGAEHILSLDNTFKKVDEGSGNAFFWVNFLCKVLTVPERQVIVPEDERSEDG